MPKLSLQIKHSLTMMLNSVSHEDCSLTTRLVQNFFKRNQSELSKSYRYVVSSLEEITQHLFHVLPVMEYEKLTATLSWENDGRNI